MQCCFLTAGIHKWTAQCKEAIRGFYYIYQGCLTTSLALSRSPPLSVCRLPLSPSGVHVFGLLATALVTDVIQLATGYHAPFFLTVCQPNYTAPGVSCDNNAYIIQDICMGKDQYAIMSARWGGRLCLELKKSTHGHEECLHLPWLRTCIPIYETVENIWRCTVIVN